MLVALCPVCGDRMPAYWPDTNRPRVYCSQYCRSKGTMLNRLEREQSDIDEEVVHRLIEGEPVIATQAERMAAVKHLSTQLDSGLNADGTPRKSRWGTEIVNPDPDKPMTATEMARRIGVSQSTASRYLRMLAEPTRFLTMEESRSRVNILCARVIHKMTLIGWLIEKRH